MPLRDHFHPPLSDDLDWESLHSAWANALVRDLNDRLLSPRYRAQPEVRLSQHVEIDVATFERDQQPAVSETGNGVATEVWAPPRATRTVDIDPPAEDLFEVRVVDRERGRRLVAAVELISPRNKDRPEARQAFAIKCASYLHNLVSVVIVDVVTSRHADLYSELLGMLNRPQPSPWPGAPPLYSVALRANLVEERWQLETWEGPLAVGSPIPTLPLWLAGNLAVPLELEATYEEVCRTFRLS